MSNQFTRREFLLTVGGTALGAALGSGVLSRALSAFPPPLYRFYLGTYTDSSSKGIYQGWLDGASGALKREPASDFVANPSFLTLARSGRFLYAVNELDEFHGEPTGSVSAFTVNRETGFLTLLNSQPSGGKSPCHISLDQTGRFALVANYTSGTVSVLPIKRDGSLEPASCTVQHTGSGPNHDRQASPHAHCVGVSPDNHFVIAADLGADRLMVYRFDARRGLITPTSHPSVQIAPGSGPRHFTFDPEGQLVYLVNELASTMTVLTYVRTTATLTVIQTISTLPADYHGENAAAEVVIHPSGHFLYASNRGHDSIAVFRLDRSSGRLFLLQHQPTQGSWPRSFAIDPSGKFLLLANQRSSALVAFAIDGKEGTLAPTGKTLDVPSPVCVQFAVDKQ